MPSAESRVPRRVLAQHLRDLRIQAGLKTRLAASLMEWSEPKLWRIETGQIAIRALDVEAMCNRYGVTPGLTAALVALARNNRAPGWWRAHGQATPGGFSIYAALEDAACHLTAYAPAQIPALLRTGAYARALATSTGNANTEVDRLASECLTRQVLVTRADAPLELTIALDEALLRRPAGGPQVMAEQLRFLAGIATHPNVSVRIVPASAGTHPGLVTGAFSVLDFPPSGRDPETDTPIVYAASLTGELYLDKSDEVQRYRAAHAAILGCSLDETATRDVLLQAAKELEQ
jgi:hypothetical protein